jgi:hypothetical protein
MIQTNDLLNVKKSFIHNLFTLFLRLAAIWEQLNHKNLYLCPAKFLGILALFLYSIGIMSLNCNHL